MIVVVCVTVRDVRTKNGERRTLEKRRTKMRDVDKAGVLRRRNEKVLDNGPVLDGGWSERAKTTFSYL